MPMKCDAPPVSADVLELMRAHAHEAEDAFCVYQCATSIEMARNALQAAKEHLKFQLALIDMVVPVKRLNELDHSAAELILRRERNINSLRLYNKDGREAA